MAKTPDVKWEELPADVRERWAGFRDKVRADRRGKDDPEILALIRDFEARIEADYADAVPRMVKQIQGGLREMRKTTRKTTTRRRGAPRA
jgi:hypothetical protein